MDSLITKLAGLGVPGLVLIFVMGSTGFAGAAALTTALAALGGPFGMLGGIAVLGILATLATAIAQYGVDEIAKKVVSEMINSGRVTSDIINEINSFPLISTDLRAKLRDFVQNHK